MINLTFHLVQFPVLITGMLSSILAIYLYTKRDSRGGLALTVLASGISIWSLNYFFELVASDLDVKIFFAKIEYIGIVIIPAAWLVFSLQYTRRINQLTRQQLGLLCIHPVLILLLVLTNESHHLIWKTTTLNTEGDFPLLVLTHGSVFWLHVIYTYIFFGLATFILLNDLMQSPELYRGQIIALLVSSLMPWLGNMLYVANISPTIDPSPFSFLITIIGMTWGISRYGLLNIVPIAHERLIESLVDGIIVINENNEIVELNPSARKMLNGTENKLLVGTKVYEHIHAGPFRAANLKHKDETAYDEMKVSTVDNKELFLDMRISPIREKQQIRGRVIVLRDITQRKHFEQNLKRQSLVLENITDSVIVTDLEGKIIQCNPATTQLFGYQQHDLINKRLDVWIKSETYPQTENDITKTLAENKRWEGEIVFCRKNGEVGVCETTVVLFQDDRSKALGRVVVSRDITQRKETERLLREAKETAENANQAKTTFLANMSHEFRTPLTAIVGYSDLIADDLGDTDPEVIRADLKKIQVASNHLLNLIDGVLSIAKIETGKVEFQIEAFSVKNLVNEVQITMGQLAENSRNKIEINVDADVNAMVSDALKIKQILLNLLGNANKFTKDGILKLNVSRHVDKNDVAWIKFSVVDTGIGITPEQLALVFEPFHQVDASSTREFGGSGLGLTISRYFSKMLGGNLTAESTPGEGSAFSLVLPERYRPT